MKRYPTLLVLGTLGLLLLAAACSPKSGRSVSTTPLLPQPAPINKAYLQALTDQPVIINRFSRKLIAKMPLIQARPTSTFSIVAVGDMMLGTNYPDPKYLPPGDGSQILADMVPYLQNADLTVGNLEGTLLNEGGTPKRCGNPDACYAFRSPESYAAHFANAGFDFLSLANNHSGDFGPEGRRTTKRKLDEYGIAYAGLMGTDEIAYRSVNGTRFAFIAFAPNSGTVDVRDLNRAERLVQQADQNADLVIVTFHGGAEGADAQHVPRATEEYYKENRGNVYAFAHRVIDAGADAVLGHGPHVTRALELYKDRIIAYSLGNFATYGRFNLRGPAGVAPLLKFQLDESGAFIEGKIVPIYQTKPTGPNIDDRQRATNIIRRLSQEDFPESPLLIDEAGNIRRITG